MNSNIKFRVKWLTTNEGGRARPFTENRYTPTARFTGEAEQFSVVLEFANPGMANPEMAYLRLLNPDMAGIQERLIPNAALEIMEGLRVVARGVIEPASARGAVGGIGEPQSLMKV